jgi:hypothetical protein
LHKFTFSLFLNSTYISKEILVASGLPSNMYVRLCESSFTLKTSLYIMEGGLENVKIFTFLQHSKC